MVLITFMQNRASAQLCKNLILALDGRLERKTKKNLETKVKNAKFAFVKVVCL